MLRGPIIYRGTPVAASYVACNNIYDPNWCPFHLLHCSWWRWAAEFWGFGLEADCFTPGDLVILADPLLLGRARMPIYFKETKNNSVTCLKNRHGQMLRLVGRISRSCPSDTVHVAVWTGDLFRV